MTRARHLADAALLALARRGETRLPASSERHLEGCEHCQRALRDFRALASHLRAAPAEPSPGVLARAWALVEPRPPRREDASRFVLARLVSDTAAGPAALGLRAAMQARQQLWRVPAADFDVRLDPPGLGSPGMLVGQVLPRRPVARAPQGGTVWLKEHGRPPRWAALGAGGEFALPAPQGRRWSLWLEWGSLCVRLELP